MSESKLEAVTDQMYGSAANNSLIPAHWVNRLLLTQPATLRMSSILGYILGLSHAGKVEQARAMLADLEEQLKWIVDESDKEITDSTGQTFKVPLRKVILNDDGTLHGFAVSFYYPEKPTKKAVFQIRLRIDDPIERFLTEENATDSIGYKFGYNGGLIYHGPGAGETFTTSLTKPKFWQLHT
jgi:hypothetical protein